MGMRGLWSVLATGGSIATLASGVMLCILAAVSPKTRFQIMLDPEQLDALRAKQEETGVTVGEQIRRAINAVLPVTIAKKTERKRAGTRKRS
jgi:hypothetical protein